VRELRNVADRFVLGLPGAHEPTRDAAASVPLTLGQQLDLVEKALIEQTLRQHQGRPIPVCETLGIAKKTLYDKMHRHGIVIEQYRSPADAEVRET
jgi:DNA-binding NtrC family response regulator